MADMAGNMEGATGGITPPQHTNDNSWLRALFTEPFQYQPRYFRDMLGTRVYDPMMEDQSKIKINVEHVNGKRFMVDVKIFGTVRNVKQEVAKRMNISAEECVLLYHKEELEDRLRLYEKGIINGSTINMLPRKGNGLFDSVATHFNDAYETIKNLVKWFPGIFSDTSQKLTEKDLGKIANAIGKGWKLLGSELGLTLAQMEQISEDNKSTTVSIFYMLSKWRLQNPIKATVRALHVAMKNCNNVTIDWPTIEDVLTGL